MLCSWSGGKHISLESRIWNFRISWPELLSVSPTQKSKIHFLCWSLYFKRRNNILLICLAMSKARHTLPESQVLRISRFISSYTACQENQSQDFWGSPRIFFDVNLEIFPL
jgi:hypothetical protein